MSKMIYRNIGNTPLHSSIIGLGGEWFNGLSQNEVTSIFDVAMQNGINYIDIFMPHPEVRTQIGNALKGRREKMIIQGHLCTIFEDGQYERTRDINKTKASFEDLLNRLQTDYIDVGMIHYVDSFDDYDRVFNSQIIEYAKELKQKGIVKHLGLSSHNPIVALKAVESGLIDVLMFSINAAYDFEKSDADIFEIMEYKDLNQDGWSIDPARQKLYATCESMGVGITVMKSLGAGSLLKAETSPFGKEMTVVECCHYCLTRPGVTSVLVGVSNIEQLNEALAYLSSTADELDYTHVFNGNNSVRITGKCMYCNHCQPCPSQIDIAAVTKYLDLAQLHEQIPQTISQHYHSLEKNASDCIMCGNCEQNCPFSVNVRDNMVKAQKLFK